MKYVTHTRIRIAVLGLCLLAACAPATKMADPAGGLAGPIDESTALGLWAYEVTGSCFLLRGDLLITRDRSGLSARLTEKPFAANESPDLMQTLRDQQRCAGRRGVSSTIVMDEVCLEGEMLVFSGSSMIELGTPFRLHGRVKVKDNELSGTLTIDGSQGDVIRNEAARMEATRQERGGEQPYEVGAAQ